MEPEAPPPYSEVDPHSPNTEAAPRSAPLTSPSHVSLRGGYIRGVPFHEDPAAPSYFQERAFDFRPDLPLVVVDRDITPDTVRENIQFPSQVEGTRDLTQQDWQTFINYVLTELGNETPTTKKKQKKRLSPEEFQDRQSKIEAVIAQWNEGFFQPRSIKFVPHFYYNRPPSPSPSYRTLDNVREGTSHRQPAAAPIHPHHLNPPVPPTAAGPMHPMNRSCGPGRAPFSGFGGPFGPWSSPFGHAGGPFGRGGFRGRGCDGPHHGQHHHHPHGSDDFHVPHHGGRRHRSHSASSSSSSSSDSDSDSEDDHHHHGGFQGRRGRRGFGERRGRGRHRGGHHHGRRHRSSSTSSSSSSSSDSSMSSFSSDDLAGANMNNLRTSFANFQLDPTNRRQQKVAFRQLRSDLRAQHKEAKKNKTSLKRELSGLPRDQKRELGSELKDLSREAKRRRREAKRQYKATKKEQKKARKAAKKASKRRTSEPPNQGQSYDRSGGERSRGLVNEQQLGTTTTPDSQLNSTTTLPAYSELEKGQSREVNGEDSPELSRRETRRKAKDLDRKVRDLREKAQEYSRQIEAREKEFERQAGERMAEADRQAQVIERESEEQAKDLQRKGEKPLDLQRQAADQVKHIRSEAERVNDEELHKCMDEIRALNDEASKVRNQADLAEAQARGLWDSISNGPESSRAVPDHSVQYTQTGGVRPEDPWDTRGWGSWGGYGPETGYGAGVGPGLRMRGVGFGTGIGNRGEALGRQIEAWGERFGRNMEVWGEHFGRRMEARGKALERRFT